MELTITGRNIGITDRFRNYATEKSDKVEHLADERSQLLEVRLSRHSDKAGLASLTDRVELTLVGPGPLVRAEAEGSDKYSAFDLALGKLLERLRRAKDRRKVHRGKRRPLSLAEASGGAFRAVDLEPASVEMIQRVATGDIRVVDPEPQAGEEDYSPVVIRHKVFPAELMTKEEAVDRMELVGHDFFLFIDAESDRPSVVYRRKGWDYGVIGLEAQEAVTGRSGSARRASR